ncbi:hypothetical protein FS749_015185 [Ceratobasidium sp. UAMH 11750]|nr:hypothetical protein FS749_015185 [Ceratobasidium sp. UAMH 11750]
MPICPCCHDELDERQIYRHLEVYDRAFDLVIGDLSMESAPGADGDSDDASDDHAGSTSDSDSDFNLADADAGDNLGAGGDLGLAGDLGAGSGDQGHKYNPAPAYAHADMDLGGADPVLPLLATPEPCGGNR